jgi:hypothetical protein
VFEYLWRQESSEDECADESADEEFEIDEIDVSDESAEGESDESDDGEEGEEGGGGEGGEASEEGEGSGDRDEQMGEEESGAAAEVTQKRARYATLSLKINAFMLSFESDYAHEATTADFPADIHAAWVEYHALKDVLGPRTKWQLVMSY